MLHLSVLCWNNYVGKHFKQQASWHFFFPPFTNDGIFCTCTFILSVLVLYQYVKLLPHLKDCIFILFCILPFIYQFPCALDCTLRCIFL